MTTKSASVIDQEIAKRVLVHRIQLGLSQTEVGEKLSVTFQQIQKYEKGVNRISAGRLFQLATVFNIPVETLFPKPAPFTEANAPSPPQELCSDILFTADSRRMCLAFAKIEDSRVRKKVIALVEALTEPNEQ